MEIYTWPSEDEMKEREAIALPYMRPNRIPYAVIAEGYLTEAECDAILYFGMSTEDPYSFGGCHAHTRELGQSMHLNPLEEFAREVNFSTWNYDLDRGAQSWLQTYNKGDYYDRHTDTSPGQMRKLTAIVQLTDPRNYIGGLLQIFAPPELFNPPPSRGTIVVFQPWLQHEVTELVYGTRQSINMGFWGPNFK